MFYMVHGRATGYCYFDHAKKATTTTNTVQQTLKKPTIVFKTQSKHSY